MGNFINLIGQRFGRLTVEKYLPIEDRKDKKSIWLCKCDCGNYTEVSSNHLTTFHTTSCGCYHRERVAQIARETKSMKNKYEFVDNYVIGYTNKGHKFFFDIEDYDIVSQYFWRRDDNGYIVASDKQDGVKTLYWMHRLIVNASNEYDVDHIHGKESRNDNRKSNLRIATRSQNAMNRGVASNNTSTVTGVRWHNASNKWQVSIGVNNQSVYLGVYDDFDTAVMVRKQAEEKYFREWSYEHSQAI